MPGKGYLKKRSALLALSLISPLLISQPIAPQISFAASAGSSPCVAEVQSASTVVTANANGYCYIVFKSGTNTWTVPAGITAANIAIIGGGGAGGAGAWAGGGGAGGVLYLDSRAITPGGTYSLSIGAGGTAGLANLDGITNRSNNGGDSWFESSSTFVAKGGGAGASYAWGTGSAPFSACDGNSGGSGGGAPECNNNGYSNDGGTSNQTLPSGASLKFGNAGGGTPTFNYASGGGGGGAGAAGTAVTASANAGAGGDGTNYFATWISAITSSMSTVSGWSTATTNGYIAGGGGGSSANPGAGGRGGGGNGGGNGGVNSVNSTTTGGAGAANTGGGGGAAGYSSGAGVAGAGGSGLIIVRYTLPSTISLSISGSPSSVIYNQPISITATISGSDGAVTIYADGKAVAKCISKASVSLAYTCAWKPTVHKVVTLTAKLVNTSTVYSTPIKVQVVKRTNTR